MLARLTEQEAYDRELSRTSACMDCGATRSTPHTIMCARTGVVGHEDADTLFAVYKDGLPMGIRVNTLGQAIDALLDHASVRHLNVRPDRIDVTVHGGPFTSYTVDLIDEDRAIRFDVG